MTLLDVPRPSGAVASRLIAVDLELVLDRPVSELRAALAAAVEGSAFEVVALYSDVNRAVVRFQATVAVAWASVIELQHRVHRVAEIVGATRALD